MVETRADPFIIAARTMKAFGASRPFGGANHRMGLKAATTILALCGYNVDFKQALKKTEIYSLSDDELKEYFYMSAMYDSRFRSQSSSQSRNISSRSSSGVISEQYAAASLNTLPAAPHGSLFKKGAVREQIYMARRYGKAGQEHAEVEAFSEKATASRAILEADSVPALKDAMARPKALFISGSMSAEAFAELKRMYSERLTELTLKEAGR